MRILNAKEAIKFPRSSGSKAQTFRFPLSRGSTTRLSLLPGDAKTTLWVVFLPGSAIEHVSADDSDILGLLPQGAPLPHILVINKSRTALTRQKRFTDTLEVMHEVIPRHHQIILMGYSEGAYLAPSLAQRSKRVQGLILLAGGTRGWIEEELRKMSPSEAASSLNEIAQILRGQSPQKIWRGHRHETWLSYETRETFNALSSLNRPTLVIAGSKDELIDVPSLRKDALLLQAQKPQLFQFNLLKGFNHSFNDQWASLGKYSKPFISRLMVGLQSSSKIF